MRASRLASATLAVAALTFGCSATSTSQSTTTAAASAASGAEHDAAGLVEYVSAAPPPPDATCATPQDLTSEGDITRTARILYSDASDTLVGQITLQETDPEYVDELLANTVKRNSLDLVFAGVEDAKTRAPSGTPGNVTDGTPVAFARDATVVLMSAAVGREGDLATWAPAVEAYVTSPGAQAPAVLPPCP